MSVHDQVQELTHQAENTTSNFRTPQARSDEGDHPPHPSHDVPVRQGTDAHVVLSVGRTGMEALTINNKSGDIIIAVVLHILRWDSSPP